jgi:hypothetical protein
MIEFTIQGVAPSTPNLREHWAATAKRVKAQRAAVARKMPAWSEGPLLIVRLTRVGPRLLDTDNLAAALKGHRDAVAARLRVDDASPLVKWEYHQAKGEPAVVVNAWKAGQQVPAYLRDASMPRNGDAAKAKVREVGEAMLREETRRRARAAYTPPRSTPVDAAKEAEVFAPPACTVERRCGTCEDCRWVASGF